jgi:hypothetical protein
MAKAGQSKTVSQRDGYKRQAMNKIKMKRQLENQMNVVSVCLAFFFFLFV